ncbi:hypothetical protein J7M23_10350 [Candidatus Sumerlaeota bacterium]|nr:hypothetical protein [Candidatus Sumerlaeota bacterium]
MQRFGVPILPMFTIRTGLDRHKVIFKPPIYPDSFFEQNGVHSGEHKRIRDDVSRSEVIVQVVREYTKLLESVVREYPEQYFWFHRRWKTKKK